MVTITERASSPLSRAQLADLRDELEQELRRLTPVSASVEGGTTLDVRAQERTQMVAAALARMSTKSYGTCRRCRGPIPYERLAAIPEATVCVRCTGRPA
ncbi:MAG: TraR/DksA C4-type zinc finger protein [Gemmatimonadales bacterium]